jgi:four helix bundle protein
MTPPYRSLKAWQLSYELALAIARRTKSFPPEERFELTSQLRRAALSAPSNLAERSARFGNREYLRHARIAAASLVEVDLLLLFAHDLGYLCEDDHGKLDQLRRRASYLIHRLCCSLDRRKK